MTAPHHHADLKVRLEAAVRRRDELAQKRQRLLGRLEEAERALEDLRGKCRDRNIDPDDLDSVIHTLETNLERSITTLESKLNEVEQALEPFINRKAT
jgi:chromosome segregation ATPase